jgi:hypothetical protein
MRTALLYTAAASLLLFGACERGVKLHAVVHIPPNLQSSFSPEQPGEVFFKAEIPKTGQIAYSLGVICEPSEKTLEVRIEHDGYGCAKAGRVMAWIAPAEPRGQGAPVACNLGEQRRSYDPVNPDGALGYAEASAFPDQTAQHGCKSGSASFVLELGTPPK